MSLYNKISNFAKDLKNDESVWKIWEIYPKEYSETREKIQVLIFGSEALKTIKICNYFLCWFNCDCKIFVEKENRKKYINLGFFNFYEEKENGVNLFDLFLVVDGNTDLVYKLFPYANKLNVQQVCTEKFIHITRDYNITKIRKLPEEYSLILGKPEEEVLMNFTELLLSTKRRERFTILLEHSVKNYVRFSNIAKKCGYNKIIYLRSNALPKVILNNEGDRILYLNSSFFPLHLEKFPYLFKHCCEDMLVIGKENLSSAVSFVKNKNIWSSTNILTGENEELKNIEREEVKNLRKKYGFEEKNREKFTKIFNMIGDIRKNKLDIIIYKNNAENLDLKNLKLKYC